jgi:hypothetical protein
MDLKKFASLSITEASPAYHMFSFDKQEGQRNGTKCDACANSMADVPPRLLAERLVSTYTHSPGGLVRYCPAVETVGNSVDKLIPCSAGERKSFDNIDSVFNYSRP